MNTREQLESIINLKNKLEAEDRIAESVLKAENLQSFLRNWKEEDIILLLKNPKLTDYFTNKNNIKIILYLATANILKEFLNNPVFKQFFDENISSLLNEGLKLPNNNIANELLNYPLIQNEPLLIINSNNKSFIINAGYNTYDILLRKDLNASPETKEKYEISWERVISHLTTLKNDSKVSLLKLAVKTNNIKMVKLILENNTDLFVLSTFLSLTKNNEIIEALENNLAKSLSSASFDLKDLSDTSLSDAAKYCSLKSFNQMIEAVKDKPQFQQTLNQHLHWAIRADLPQVVNRFLAVHADVTATVNNNSALWNVYTAHARDEILQAIVNANPDNINSFHNAYTAMHYFSLASVSKLKILIDKKPNVNLEVSYGDEKGYTPLDFALRSSIDITPKVIELLLCKAKTSPHIWSNLENQHALDLVKLFNHLENKAPKTYSESLVFLQLLNAKITNHRDYFYNFVESFIKIDLLIATYHSSNPVRKNAISQLIEMREQLIKQASLANNEDKVLELTRSFTNGETQIMSAMKTDHSLHGALRFFGTQSTLARKIENAVTPLVKFGKSMG